MRAAPGFACMLCRDVHCAPWLLVQVPALDGKLPGKWLAVGAAASVVESLGCDEVRSADTMGCYWTRQAQHFPSSFPPHGSCTQCPCMFWHLGGQPGAKSSAPAPCAAVHLVLHDDLTKELEKAITDSVVPPAVKKVSIRLAGSQLP
jgi:hypothetical protein